MKKRLFEILEEPKQFLRDGEKLIFERDEVRVILFNDGETLSAHEIKRGDKRWI